MDSKAGSGWGQPKFLLCSNCFHDIGLKLEAQRIGRWRRPNKSCPNCASRDGYTLDSKTLHALQRQFFSRATAPNQFRDDIAVLGLVEDDPPYTDIGLTLRPEAQADWDLIQSKVGGRLFYRSPRLFFLGITNHFGLHQSLPKDVVRNDIVPKLRFTEIDPVAPFYRIRVNLTDANKFDEGQYDSPPKPRRRRFGRFDNPKLPLLYASPNLQVCIHECKVTLADDIFVATVAPTRTLRLLDLSGNYDQPEFIDPFDDLLWFFRGLMNTSLPHVYRYCRRIAQTIKEMTDADGFLYNSYYTNVAGDTGGKAINYALFGHPISEGKLRIVSINTIRLNRITYDYHLGPLFY
jgi:RES domain